MSRFRFRLERVLGVRRIEADVARAEWLEAERQALAAEAAAQRLRETMERARGELGRLQSSPRLAAADVLVQQGLIDRLRDPCVQKTILSSRLRREAERLRQALAERRVRVRGLETLEGRQRQDWRLDLEASANAELDERASLRRSQARPDHADRAERGTLNPS